MNLINIGGEAGNTLFKSNNSLRLESATNDLLILQSGSDVIYFNTTSSSTVTSRFKISSGGFWSLVGDDAPIITTAGAIASAAGQDMTITRLRLANGDDGGGGNLQIKTHYASNETPYLIGELRIDNNNANTSSLQLSAVNSLYLVSDAATGASAEIRSDGHIYLTADNPTGGQKRSIYLRTGGNANFAVNHDGLELSDATTIITTDGTIASATNKNITARGTGKVEGYSFTSNSGALRLRPVTGYGTTIRNNSNSDTYVFDPYARLYDRTLPKAQTVICLAYGIARCKVENWASTGSTLWPSYFHTGHGYGHSADGDSERYGGMFPSNGSGSTVTVANRNQWWNFTHEGSDTASANPVARYGLKFRVPENFRNIIVRVDSMQMIPFDSNTLNGQVHAKVTRSDTEHNGRGVNWVNGNASTINDQATWCGRWNGRDNGTIRNFSTIITPKPFYGTANEDYYAKLEMSASGGSMKYYHNDTWSFSSMSGTNSSYCQMWVYGCRTN